MPIGIFIPIVSTDSAITGDAGNAVIIDDDGIGLKDAGAPPGVAIGGGADLVGTGFGTDQRAAIQAKLDALPATGGRVVLKGQFRVDAPLTIPANAASATGEATFALEADGFCEIKAGGTQDFHILNWSGYGITQKLNFTIRGIRLIGLWEEQADGASKANSSYRGIKIDYVNKAIVQNCWADNVRGFSISIDKCTEGVVEGCTVTRSGKDGINVNNCVVTRIDGNTVYGCGDNGIAAHTGVRTSGSGATGIQIGSLSVGATTNVVSVTFTASNSAVVGDKLVITTAAVVNGLNVRGTWTIATKPTGSTCTFLHDLTSTSGTPATNSGILAWEIGTGWEESRQSTHITNNHVENSFGIKALGGPNTLITNNTIKTVHGTAIHVGGEGAGGEGMVDYRSLTIAGNQITDVIKKAYLGMNAPSDACILVDHRWSSIGQARIEGNILNCNRPLRSGETKPSDWMRGYTPPNGGPASPQHKFFSADGWIDTAFSGEPTYQVIKGIEIRAKNALERNAIRVKNNSFSGLVANQAVRRYAPINGGTRVRPTIANASIANWEALLSGSYSLLNLDLTPAYGVGIRARKGAATSTQPTVVLECRFRKNDGIGVDGYVETSWASGTAFATAQATLSSDNTDATTAITALPADAKRSMDVVPFGATSVNGNPFELISLELIVDHADNDSDYVAPGIVYDPEGIYAGGYLGRGVVSAATWATMTSGEKAGRDWDIV